jgi:prolyl oligopeptidase
MRDVTKSLIGFGSAWLLIGAAPPAQPADPHLDLEQVDGAAAMVTVKGWNAKTLAALEKQPGFAKYQSRALALLSDDRKIAEPDRIIGDRVLNLWQDAAHPRGLWRVSPLTAFASGKPEWRTLIDLAALGKTEGKRWAFKGADCRAPAYDRCIVALSDGGGDAVVRREFDMDKVAFVNGGFVVPQGKSETAWAGPDALYVATDFGPGTTTTSGYARIVKLWRRGTPLASAKILLEGEVSDVSVSASVSVDGDMIWPMLRRGIDFYHSKVLHLAPDGRLVSSPLPLDADVNDIVDGHAIATLKSAWQAHPAGSIVAYSIPDVLAGKTPTIETLFEPNAHQAVQEVAATRSALWVNILDDVSGKLLQFTRDKIAGWHSYPVPLPANATVHLNAAAGSGYSVFATVEGMLTPPTLYKIETQRPDRTYFAWWANQVTPIQSLPARFDASKMKVEQHFATSKDGTKVPYFLVRRIDAIGPVPAYIHAYGGFELAQTPGYLVNEPYRSGPAALFWVEEGNAYVLANLRGGGEYGPAWHDAALREKRQNAYDDLYAVADDLIATGVTQKKRIAASGRSNGGLLVSVAMTQRPDLYGAIVMGSPLADMKRYSHLPAGASWRSEYGDPDKTADWAFISKYSPYQNLKPGVKYPVPFIYTSTRDDRVHPGHARKFAARLQDYRDPFFYYEAIEGGHAAGVELKEDALRAALVTVYLNLELPR